MQPPRGGSRLAAGGSGAARRAVVRWAWRLFRREWRAQGLVIGLLITVVTASIVSSSIASNVVLVGGNAASGTATHLLRFDGSDPQQLRADLAAVDEWFGTTEAITERSVQVPGAFDRLELRGIQPDGPYSGPMLALRDGRYPAGGDEVAVTDRVLQSFALDLGGAFTVGGRQRTVVGLVENPNDLRQEFVLVDPAAEERPDSVTILVQSTTDRVGAFRSPSMSTRSNRGSDMDVATAAALIMLGTASIGLAFVALIAVASFVVLAQRRLRQLGMLAAIGATEQHLRLVTVANGIVVGIVAAVAGGVLGVAIFVAIAPALEEPFGHRFDRLGVPWWLVGSVMLLALVAATAAAWWPARTAARVPITVALSGRPPATRATRSSAARALALVVAGMALLLVGRLTNVAPVSGVGTLVAIVGVLLLGPVLSRAAALPARRMPVAARIALRDLSRYRARSGAALAAVALALFLTTSITIAASAAALAPDEGNLSSRQLMIRIGDPDAPILPPDLSPFFPVLAPADLEAREDGARRIATQLEDARLVPLDVAFDPSLGIDPRFDTLSAITLAERVTDDVGARKVDLTLLYVASAEMLEYYGVDLSTQDAQAQVLTAEPGELLFSGTFSGEPEQVTNARALPPRYSSMPGSFITEAALRELGWDKMRAAWFVEASAPLTSIQVAEARSTAAEAGLTIEFRDQQEGLLALRGQATAASVVVALGIIAMTVGLIRSEAGRDLRTLTATGATGMTRRIITATTAGALAILGVALGMAGAYLVLGAGYLDAMSLLASAPLVEVGITGLGVPLAAVAMGWLMAGGEPPTLARQPVE
jgi:putative ABC transport system permease protein